MFSTDLVSKFHDFPGIQGPVDNWTNTEDVHLPTFCILEPVTFSYNKPVNSNMCIINAGTAIQGAGQPPSHGQHRNQRTKTKTSPSTRVQRSLCK